MFYFEKCYDLDELARRNMHVHSNFSRCAKPEMTYKAIVKRAEECGLTDIAVTDHLSAGFEREFLENNEILKKLRAENPSPVNVRIGSELSAYGEGKYGSPEIAAALEYRLFAQNHYHLDVWERPPERTREGYAKHMVSVLTGLFKTGLADCVAHPFAPVKIRDLESPEKILDFLSDEILGDIMEKGEKAGCAWELHAGCVLGWPEFGRRYFNVGREVGVHFNFASDAHRLRNVDPRPYIERFKKILL